GSAKEVLKTTAPRSFSNNTYTSNVRISAKAFVAIQMPPRYLKAFCGGKFSISLDESIFEVCSLARRCVFVRTRGQAFFIKPSNKLGRR
ncbi:hypothetical protein U1Q18_049795, partial [Sarracenia purpurea var. burkii]